MTSLTNMSASVHQRLLNRANSEKRTFNELLQYYSMERFLYRLGQSKHSEQFVLKGAIVFLVWQVPLSRPTRDIDFLGYTENSVENLEQIVKSICEQSVEIDGIEFDVDTIQGLIIKEGAEYHGVRITFLAFLGNARVHMQLDVGFADIITPPPIQTEMPTLLDEFNKPFVRVYPPETVVAEKFQTMVDLGMFNSRIKDFYDLWFITRTMIFNYSLLHEAIENTFFHRNTPIPIDTPPALTKEFANQKQVQWEAFLKKNQLTDAPTDIRHVQNLLFEFFKPLIFPSEIHYTQWSSTHGWVV
ncbi:MAG: nucleotidyl transferase AbiEii/AbiGii toxin family protein [Kiritimatiellae bacterium]|nr:nucleotidyl transferase AbiEii/AbiGii toxin family protein [Kiritimatiellia bacterium]